ncbi:hypothetical protein QTG54_005660 [Skeletonema marinoi]|uniref:Uncharacterized protein n=1 Tax=Skeletonema marinoi TaxID=267567 RepID=A0AAD8YE05_9STRA|nr:hypothetical protein QTG54_005660 [Skeletonema marinoi]
MNDDKMSSSDGVEISSCGVVRRDESMKMASQVNTLLRNKADHNDQSQRDEDEESAASSSVTSSKMAQCRGKSKAETSNRRHVFDELTKVKNLNTSLAHPGRGEMWFGDLDFDYDINGEWVQNIREEHAGGTMPLLPLLNDASASYVQMNA